MNTHFHHYDPGFKIGALFINITNNKLGMIIESAINGVYKVKYMTCPNYIDSCDFRDMIRPG